MKAKDLRQLGNAERDQKLVDLKKEMMKLKVATKTGPGNTARIRQIKKDIARILTLRKNE